MTDEATIRVAYDLYEVHARKRPTMAKIAQTIGDWNITHKWSPLTLDAAQFLIDRLWPQYPPFVRLIRTAEQESVK